MRGALQLVVHFIILIRKNKMTDQNTIRLRRYYDKKKMVDELPIEYDRPLLSHEQFSEWSRQAQPQKQKVRFTHLITSLMP